MYYVCIFPVWILSYGRENILKTFFVIKYCFTLVKSRSNVFSKRYKKLFNLHKQSSNDQAKQSENTIHKFSSYSLPEETFTNIKTKPRSFCEKYHSKKAPYKFKKVNWNLSKNNNIIVLKQDKGRRVVIMNHTKCIAKCYTISDSNQFTKLKIQHAISKIKFKNHWGKWNPWSLKIFIQNFIHQVHVQVNFMVQLKTWIFSQKCWWLAISSCSSKYKNSNILDCKIIVTIRYLRIYHQQYKKCLQNRSGKKKFLFDKKWFHLM